MNSLYDFAIIGGGIVGLSTAMALGERYPNAKIFFNDIPFITTTDNEIINTVSRVSLHYVPENWLTTNFNHWFGSDTGFFT